MDPLSASALKALASGADTVGKEVGSLTSRMLGPAADEFGTALARVVERRVRNWGRIAERAESKGGDRPGVANLRVAYHTLEEGSLCDDDVMVEYLSGALAASRSPQGTDDRAIVWTRLVTSLSTLQI